jgi:uncharacterized RDD family membrane protein YckC
MQSVFLRRVGAHFIDSVLFYAFVFAAQFTLLRNVVQTSWPGWQFESYLFSTVTLPVVLYYALCESSHWQATVGKRVMGLRVTNAMGERIGFGQGLVRALVRFLPFEIGHMTFALPEPIWVAPDEFRVGFLIVSAALVLYTAIAFFHPRGQSVHDLAAQTVVVRQNLVAAKSI